MFAGQVIEWQRNQLGSWHARVGEGLWVGHVGQLIGGTPDPRPWCASFSNRSLGRFPTEDEAKEAVEYVFIADLDAGKDWSTPTVEQARERVRRRRRRPN